MKRRRPKGNDILSQTPIELCSPKHKSQMFQLISHHSTNGNVHGLSIGFLTCKLAGGRWSFQLLRGLVSGSILLKHRRKIEIVCRRFVRMSGCPSMVSLLHSNGFSMFCICFSVFNHCLNVAWYESMPSSLDFACRSQGPEVPSLLRLSAGQSEKLKSTLWWNWTDFRDLYGFVTKKLMLLCIFKSIETIQTFWEVDHRNRLDSNFKKEVGMSKCQGWYHETSGPLKVFAWVWVGLVDGVMEQQHVHKVWLPTDHLSTKCHVSCRRWLEISLFWTWFWLQNSILCTVGPIGDFPFLVSNSWCVHPRLCCSSFSSSATRLGGCDLAYLVEHADPLLISWISDGIDFIGLVDFIVLIDWLLCVHLMSCFHFRMLRLEGKSGERFLV